MLGRLVSLPLLRAAGRSGAPWRQPARPALAGRLGRLAARVRFSPGPWLLAIAWAWCALAGVTLAGPSGPGPSGLAAQDFDLSHRGYRFAEPSADVLPGSWKGKWERWREEVASGDAAARETALRLSLAALLKFEAQAERIQVRSEKQRIEKAKALTSANLFDWTWRQWINAHPAVGTWLTATALQPSGKLSHRARALELLVAARHADAETLLIHQANQDGDLRPYALQAMAHWPREALDRHLVRGYLASADDPQWYALLRHRMVEHGRLHAAAIEDLTPALVAQLCQDDWQVAGQALLLIQTFPPEARFEALMAAMPTVAEGVRSGQARWRILSDISAQLRTITGRAMGADPRPWLTFYERYHAGQLPLRADDKEGVEDASSTEFFGIGKVSDHVTFVIDVSGSMEAMFGTSGHSAYLEAVDQLITYLRAAGPDAWFQVVTFSDNAKTVVSLRQATPKTLEAVEKEMKGRRVGGGTALGEGVEQALRANRPGRSSRSQHASDSIIVLCDGATMEDEVWVERLLAQEDFPHGLRFHCVQIGSSPAPAMKALAKQTGGKFVRR